MARPTSRHPTELELEILKILWRRGPLPVREVRDELAAADNGRNPAHTSVVTMLNIMVQKGYLRRTKRRKAYGYHARVTEQSISKRMLHDIIDRVFDGSAMALMLNLFETADIDDQELKELRKLIRRKPKRQEK